MIKLVKEGDYTLIETRGDIKILKLKNIGNFVWINAAGIGEILVTTHKPHKRDHFLSIGKYRLYDVENEKKLTDLSHLELFVGDGTWQGYLLPTGLPQGKKKRNRIVATDEAITLST